MDHEYNQAIHGKENTSFNFTHKKNKSQKYNEYHFHLLSWEILNKVRACGVGQAVGKHSVSSGGNQDSTTSGEGN